jgi:hypothetical protein
MAFYDAVWQVRHPTHMVMVKLLIFMGLRNANATMKQVSLSSVASVDAVVVGVWQAVA